MKTLKYISPILILIFILLVTTDIDAQSSRKRKKKRPVKNTERVVDEDYVPFKDRLWYGSNFNLGLNNNTFLLGLSPMVGYKFNSWLSAGPTILINYTHTKFTRSGTVYNVKSFDYGGGLFARAKFLNSFFAHIEYDVTNQELPVITNNSYVIDPDDTNDLLTERTVVNEFLIGLGYHTGGDSMFGYQATILYDVLVEDTSTALPISFRVGFNYNF